MIEVAINIEVKKLLWTSFKKHKRSLPTSWAETPTIFRERLLLFLVSHSEAEAKIRALQLLLNLPFSLLFALSEAQLYDLSAQLNWYKLEPSATPILEYFTHNNITYYLPKSKIENATCAEFAIADDYFSRYIAKKDEKDLLRLVATLCRPKKANADAANADDIRTELSSRTEIENRATVFATLSPGIAVSVFYFFAGVKEFFNIIYGKHLFDGEASYDKIAQTGWWDIFMEVAETGTFGNMEQVSKTNIHALCRYLVRKKTQNDAIRRQMELKTAFTGKDIN